RLLDPLPLPAFRLAAGRQGEPHGHGLSDGGDGRRTATSAAREESGAARDPARAGRALLCDGARQDGGLLMPPGHRRNRATVGALLTVVAVMIGLTAASVPLYRLFCQVTGYGGTTQRASVAPDKEVADRLITVRFDASEAPDLGWEFRPLQGSVTVHP